MKTLKKILAERLKGASRIALLGIGSDLRADDAAGMLVAEYVNKGGAKFSSNNFKIFFGSTAPENLTGEIKKFKPTHIVITDTIDVKEKPGTIVVLMPDEVGSGVSFSTHKMPAKVLTDYLSKSIKCDIIFIGIQPKSVDFGGKLSAAVKSAAKEVALAIRSVKIGK